MLLSCLLYILSVKCKAELLEEPVEVKNQTYAGIWSTPNSGLFGTFTEKEGRSRWRCINFSDTWINRFACQLILYDGPWEDGEAYSMIMYENRFDYETRSIVINATDAVLQTLTDPERNIPIYGRLMTSPNFTLTGKIHVPGFSIKLYMEAIDIVSPKIIYTVFVSLVTMAELWALLTLAQDCNASEPTALSVSLSFLFLTCVTDCWLWLWHLYLALRFNYAFSYLILNAFWSFLMLLTNVGRVLPLVWRANHRHNDSRADNDPSVGDFHTFEGRFLSLAVIMTSLCMVFISFYPVYVVISHCVFLPQIITNAFSYRRNRVNWKITVALGGARLLFSVFCM